VFFLGDIKYNLLNLINVNTQFNAVQFNFDKTVIYDH